MHGSPRTPQPFRGRCLGFLLLALPCGAQTWDVRAEVPFPKGQDLPRTLLAGSSQLVAGNLDTGRGGILSVSRRLIRFGPVMKLEVGAEVADWKANGTLDLGASRVPARLQQRGIGAGLNLQFWIPFTGLAGEMGLLQRLHEYRYEGGGARAKHTLSRTWLRVGARWRLPYLGVHPYLCASYQDPLSRDRPVKVDSVSDLAGYFAAQGSGQEFGRVWTFGAGIQF